MLILNWEEHYKKEKLQANFSYEYEWKYPKQNISKLNPVIY